MAGSDRDSERILGVDRTLLERILVILRDKYPLADKANYFLERQGYAGINTTITNQRDALSHLVTLLSDLDLDYDGQLAQLHNAEEHLRRAVTEPYERAIDMKFDEVLKVRDTYIKLVLPWIDHPSLSGTPHIDKVDNRLRHAIELREKGRSAKARNKWDEEWENGIKFLIEAFECLEELERALGSAISRAQATSESARNLRYGRIGIVLGIAGPIVGLLLVLLV